MKITDKRRLEELREEVGEELREEVDEELREEVGV